MHKAVVSLSLPKRASPHSTSASMRFSQVKTQNTSSQAPFLSQLLEEVLQQNKWKIRENKTDPKARCSERKSKVTNKEKQVKLGGGV